jgi:hypothetical protein
MITVNRCIEDKNKSLDWKYIYCDQCRWNRVPNQKMAVFHIDIIPTNERGFIQKYETYYLEDEIKGVHLHKLEPRLIKQLLDCILCRNNVSKL